MLLRTQKQVTLTTPPKKWPASKLATATREALINEVEFLQSEIDRLIERLALTETLGMVGSIGNMTDDELRTAATVFKHAAGKRRHQKET